jgi:hypothetical protein
MSCDLLTQVTDFIPRISAVVFYPANQCGCAALQHVVEPTDRAKFMRNAGARAESPRGEGDKTWKPGKPRCPSWNF